MLHGGAGCYSSIRHLCLVVTAIFNVNDTRSRCNTYSDITASGTKAKCLGCRRLRQLRFSKPASGPSGRERIRSARPESGVRLAEAARGPWAPRKARRTSSRMRPGVRHLPDAFRPDGLPRSSRPGGRFLVRKMPRSQAGFLYLNMSLLPSSQRSKIQRL